MFGGDPVEPTGGLAERGEPAVGAVEMLVHRAEIVGELGALLHVGALGGEGGFFAGLGGEAAQFLDGMVEPFAIACSILQIGARRFQRILGRTPGGMRGRDRGDVEPAEGVEQCAMAARIDQPAIVMLAMDLDKHPAQFAQGGGGRRLVVDEGAAAAIGLDRAADHQRLAGLMLQPILLEQREGGVIGREIEGGRYRGLRRAIADEAAVGAGAERQAQCVEQDRFAGAGLARQRAEARPEFQIERLDQHDIPDRQRGQHGTSVEQSPRPRQGAVQQDRRENMSSKVVAPSPDPD
jgi:hypothetical protein